MGTTETVWRHVIEGSVRVGGAILWGWEDGSLIWVSYWFQSVGMYRAGHFTVGVTGSQVVMERGEFLNNSKRAMPMMLEFPREALFCFGGEYPNLVTDFKIGVFGFPVIV